jgi:hypothetical protein
MTQGSEHSKYLKPEWGSVIFRDGYQPKCKQYWRRLGRDCGRNNWFAADMRLMIFESEESQLAGAQNQSLATGVLEGIFERSGSK